MPVLTINGEGRSFSVSEFPATVAVLIAGLGLEPARVVAEVDGRIVSRADYAAFLLQDGQRIELVSFVGGG